jgi:hypothetical protein
MFPFAVCIGANLYNPKLLARNVKKKKERIKLEQFQAITCKTFVFCRKKSSGLLVVIPQNL